MKKIKKIVSEVFEIPSEAVGAEPLITLVGNEKIIVENSRGIAKYESEKIRINTALGLTEIEGKDMNIKVLGEQCVIAEGKIDGIKFV